jgi:hypothetical protein
VGPGIFPLDEELELTGSGYSPWLEECLVRLGTWLPFEQAPGALRFLARVEVSAETVRRLTEAAGAAQVAVDEADVERLERDNPASPPGPALLQVSVDGALVPLVGGDWAEVRTVALGRVLQTTTAAGPRFVRTTDLSYFSRLATAEELRRAAWPELYRRGIETAETVCAVQDGADWLQSFVSVFRPDAVRILDFPHAAEYLSAAAQAVFGAGTAATSEWLGRQLHEFKHGDPERVLAAVAALPVERAALPAEATTQRATTLTYLSKRRAQIRYADFQAAGYPIGSGLVESANKLVVEARLKGSGMRWARPNVNPLVALRSVACSDRWAEAWPRLSAHLRRQARARATARRTARRTARPTPPPRISPAAPLAPFPAAPPSMAPPAPATVPPPPRPKTIVNGRPTADHPWKRARACSSRPA